ncbi:MAG: hypothetical protein KDB02_05350 [Acidimicrobiales bacterium]|nr:hypothetical protein [Acidimicrobiales bacterium]
MTSPNWPPAGPVPTGFQAPPAPGAGPGVPPPPTRAAYVVRSPARTRWPDAVLLAVASATVAGVAWWAVVGHSKTQFVYGAIAVGFVVGAATATGARRVTAGVVFLAAVCTFVALVVSEYFIQRTIAVREGIPVPLWQGFGFAKDVVKAGLDENKLTFVFWLLAAGAAGFTAARRSR